MKRYAIAILLASLVSSIAFSQQSGIYSQYMFNGLAINPAYAGYDGMLEKKYYPYSILVWHEIVNDKIGVGLQVFHENIGVTEQSGVYASYSYKIFFDKLTLSLGLQAGVNFYRTN